MKAKAQAVFRGLIQRRWVAVLLLVLLAAGLRLPDMGRVNRNGWDEAAYAFFARVWSEHGVAGIRRLLEVYPHDEKLQSSPLPLRITFIVAGAETCKLLGGFTRDNLAWLSFAAGLGIVAVGILFAWEITANAAAAWLAGLLLVSSPLASGLSLRATQDTFMGLATLLVIWRFYRASRKRSLLNCTLLGLCLVVGFLTKETLVFIYPLFLCMLAWQRFVEEKNIVWQVVVPLAIAPFIYLAVVTMLCGGIGRFLSTYQLYSSLQQKLDYTLSLEKGPWHAYFVDFLALAPSVFFVAIGGLAALWPPKDNAAYGLCILLFVGTCLVFGMLPVINMRLLLSADFFLRAAAAVSVLRFSRLRPWAGPAAVVIFCGLLAIDWHTYQQVFIEGGLYNPTHSDLFRSMGFYR